jgi:ribosome-associated protein
MIEITDKISVSEDELEFRSSRSGGPGGQNVNKVNTRVTLFFDVAHCESLSQTQKQRILKKLATRVDKRGVLRVVAQKHRSQKANRTVAIERLRELLAGALKKKRPRKKTEVPRWADEKRLRDKKQRGLLKQQRAKKDWDRDMGA